MEAPISMHRQELLQVADAVAREKSIDRELVIEAMAEAIQKAARSKYGAENDVRAEIDGKTGEIRLWQAWTVVEEIEDEHAELTLEEARERQPDASYGDVLTQPLPPIDFGRIAAQTAKQVIVQKVREAERDRQYNEYKDRVGEIINGVVKRAEYGSVTVDLGRAEAVIRRDESLPRESFRRADRVRAYIVNVSREQRGPQIFLSRSHPQFMAKLFTQEVPEIYDGIIEIKAVARDPGSRAKIAVISNDGSIDPVGACVGMRGSRVQAVVNELQGEKIDIIEWQEDPAMFVVKALAPAEVAKVVLDEENGRIEVVVPDEMLSLAIGRRGQNVRLASQLTGWDIDIMTEADDSERRQEEFKRNSLMFIESLDVDEVIGQLLASEGFATVEDIAFVSIDELLQIEAFNDEIAEEIIRRAQEFLSAEDERLDAILDDKKVEDALRNVEGLSKRQIADLARADVTELDDLADLASDELLEIIGRSAMSVDDANGIIMEARKHWFDDEEDEAVEGEEEETSSDAEDA